MNRIVLISVLLACFQASAGADSERTLRVGTSGDYAPFSRVSGDDPPEYDGFDIAVARAFARDHELEIVFVRFEWGGLLSSLASERFDVAMSGVTVTPERSAAGRYTVPVVETGAVVLVSEPDRWLGIDSLDRRAVHIGVNGGGYLERVAARRFPRATLLVIPDNDGVIHALVEQRIVAAVTDTLEAPEWQRMAEGSEILGPFTRDRKAYLVRADLPELASDLDAWLLEQESSGALADLRTKYFGDAAPNPLVTPLGPLFAAVDERLSLMPLVGAAKRNAGLPLEVPERESQVLDAAVAGAQAAATRAGVEPPPSRAIRALFQAQMDAAKEVQWAAIQDPDFEPPDPLPDIHEDLRPALLRIGDRIVALLFSLPADLDRSATREAARDALRTPRLSQASIERIADAVSSLTQRTAGSKDRATTDASQPASSGTPSETP